MAESVVKDRFTKNKQTQGFKCVTRLDVKQTRIENKREITESVVIFFFILFFFNVFVCLFCFFKASQCDQSHCIRRVMGVQQLSFFISLSQALQDE